MRRTSTSAAAAMLAVLSTACSNQPQPERQIELLVTQREMQGATIEELEEERAQLVDELDGLHDTVRDQHEEIGRLRTANQRLVARQATALLDEITRLRRELRRLKESRASLQPLTRAHLALTTPVTGTFEGPFDEALAALSAKIDFPIRLMAADLAEQRIPRIRHVSVTATERPAEEVLARMLLEANPYPNLRSLTDPKMRLAYVVDDAGNPPGGSIVVTTRRRALERGTYMGTYRLPE